MKKPLILLGAFGVLLVISLLIYSDFFAPMKMMRVPIKEEARQPVPKEVPLPAPPPPELSEIVENELKKLSPGQILFNVPQEMIVGIKERVEVRITKTITEDLAKGLKGRGLPQIEEIRVNTLMGVRLNGDNFDIKALSHEEQIVAGEGFTQWAWDVTPLESGIQSLLLTVTVRIKIPNYGEERKDYPVFERKINVKVNPPYTIKKFIRSYWQWIITTIIGSGVIGWLVKKLWKSRKKKK
jgi:hypothetical protein